MPQIAAITLNDGAATPVAHTFTPAGVKDAIAIWQDKATGISVGFPAVSLSVRSPSRGSKTSRVTAKVVFPVLETLSNTASSGIVPAPTKAFDLIATLDIACNERASIQNRKDLNAFLKNFLANAAFTSALVDLEPTWG